MCISYLFKKNIQLQADGSQMSVRYVNEEGKKKALDFIDR